jgi:hypothetical protein
VKFDLRLNGEPLIASDMDYRCKISPDHSNPCPVCLPIAPGQGLGYGHQSCLHFIHIRAGLALSPAIKSRYLCFLIRRMRQTLVSAEPGAEDVCPLHTTLQFS